MDPMNTTDAYEDNVSHIVLCLGCAHDNLHG